jgi:hypothetical protein
MYNKLFYLNDDFDLIGPSRKMQCLYGCGQSVNINEIHTHHQNCRPNFIYDFALTYGVKSHFCILCGTKNVIEEDHNSYCPQRKVI